MALHDRPVPLSAGQQTEAQGGLLVTTSGMLFHVNEGWVWAHGWQDPRWISWILGITMQTGPIIAAIVLFRGTWTRYPSSAFALQPDGDS